MKLVLHATHHDIIQYHDSRDILYKIWKLLYRITAAQSLPIILTTKRFFSRGRYYLPILYFNHNTHTYVSPLHVLIRHSRVRLLLLLLLLLYTVCRLFFFSIDGTTPLSRRHSTYMRIAYRIVESTLSNHYIWIYSVVSNILYKYCYNDILAIFER
jgi:hypothetical protein